MCRRLALLYLAADGISRLWALRLPAETRFLCYYCSYCSSRQFWSPSCSSRQYPSPSCSSSSSRISSNLIYFAWNDRLRQYPQLEDTPPLVQLCWCMTVKEFQSTRQEYRVRASGSAAKEQERGWWRMRALSLETGGGPFCGLKRGLLERMDGGFEYSGLV